MLARLLATGANCILQRGVLLAIVLIGICALALLGASKIQFNDGARDLFASEHVDYQRYEDQLARYSGAETDIVLLIEAGRPFSSKQVSAMRDLVLDLQLIENVELTASIFSQQRFNPALQDFETLIDEIPTKPAALRDILEAARGSELVAAPLINTEHNQAVVLVSVSDDVSERTEADQLLRELESLIDETSAKADLALEMTGVLPLQAHVISQLEYDQMLTTIVGGILGLIVVIVLLRSALIGVLNGFAPVTALLLSMGAFGFLGLEMNPTTNVVPVLILILSMADCIHMTFEFRRKAAGGASLDDCIRQSIGEIGPPSILAGLTTILALSGLFYSQSPAIRGFATAGIVGIGMSIFATLFVHPLVFRLAARLKPVEQALRNPVKTSHLGIGAFSALIGRLLTRPALVTALGVLLAVVLTVVFLPIKTNYQYFEFVSEDEAKIVQLQRAEAIAGPTQSLIIPLEFASNDTSYDDALADLGIAHRAVEQALPDSTVISLHSMRDMLARAQGKNALEADDPTLELLPEEVLRSVVRDDDRGYAISVMVADAPSAEIRALTAKIDGAVGAAMLTHLVPQETTGYLAMAAAVSDWMIRDLAISFLIAALACPLLIGIWFRDWRYAVASFMPNTLPILLVGAWLMLTGYQLQFTSAVAFSIAFGVAVDDTVHTLNRFDIQRHGEGLNQAVAKLREIAGHVAPALVTTTLVLSVGLASTQLSTIPTMTFFGAICIVVLITALLADLLILPPILRLISGKRAAAKS